MYGAFPMAAGCETSTGFENVTRTSTVEPAPYVPFGEIDETDRARGTDVSLVVPSRLTVRVSASATTMRPSYAAATATGSENCPGRVPGVPNESASVPFW